MFKGKRLRDCRHNDKVLVTSYISTGRIVAGGLFRSVATIFYNLTDFTSNSQRSRGSSIFLNVPMNINTKAAVIYAAREWVERKKKEIERTIRYFGTHFMSRSVFMPQILAPPRGHLRFLPVESSPIFTMVCLLSPFYLLPTSPLDFFTNDSYSR